MKLSQVAKNLRARHKDISIMVFDICTLFSDIYNDTLKGSHQYPGGFEKDKIHTPFTTSKDMLIKQNLSPAAGYMFWDEMHPTADMHELLAEEFYHHITRHYIFRKPHVETYDNLCHTFQRKFQSVVQENQHKLFGRAPTLPAIDFTQPQTALRQIFRLSLKDKKILNLLKDLEWVNKDGTLNTAIPALKDLKAHTSTLEFKKLSHYEAQREIS